MITPLDIENKEFSTAKRGYEQDEVDEFLDEIIIDLQKLLRENKELKNELGRARTKIDNEVNTGSTVYETLESAKSLMNDIAASAEKRAEALIENAELEAEVIKKRAFEEVRTYTEEAKRLRNGITKLKKNYREMLLLEAKRIDEEADDFLSQIENDLNQEEEPENYTDNTIIVDKLETGLESSDLVGTRVMERIKD